jgi:hypothetical protein
MIALKILTRGADIISRRFRIKAVMLPRETAVEVEKNAQLLLTQIRARASGRPGPRVQTGAYLASWGIERPSDDTRIVSTGSPYGRRLERGFVGMDALGRHYAQPPFPHVWPAADMVEGAFVRDMSIMVTRGI